MPHSDTYIYSNDGTNLILHSHSEYPASSIKVEAYALTADDGDVVTLDYEILGLSTTINATQSDSGLEVSDERIDISAGDYTYYVVPKLSPQPTTKKKLLKVNNKILSKINDGLIGSYNTQDVMPGIELSPLPQLDAPTNLTADGTTISFDEVENAENYEVFADGVSIGEYTPVSGFTVSGSNSFHGFDSFTPNQYSLDNGLTWIDFENGDFSIENVTQIKFKTGNNLSVMISSNKLGLAIHDTETESQNFILTQDIDDISSYSVDIG